MNRGMILIDVEREARHCTKAGHDTGRNGILIKCIIKISNTFHIMIIIAYEWMIKRLTLSMQLNVLQATKQIALVDGHHDFLRTPLYVKYISLFPTQT